MPRLPDHVQAAAFHPQTSQLDLRPTHPPTAQLRLIAARIVTAANESAGTGAVRSIRVLPVGARPHRPEPRSRGPCRTGCFGVAGEDP
ncbi:hypothetical protein ACFVTT_36060 [Streptomyces niveus]|uniref:hypothetical protein n=1 Tax=Streptomyces niveus TaxID=193462 RepID=UPI0036DC4CF5